MIEGALRSRAPLDARSQMPDLTPNPPHPRSPLLDPQSSIATIRLPLSYPNLMTVPESAIVEPRCPTETAVQLTDVSFGYDRRRPVLSGIDMTIPRVKV